MNLTSSIRVKRGVSASISNIINGFRFMRALPDGMRILMYHSIGGQADADNTGLFSISTDLFSEHLRILAEITEVPKKPLEYCTLEERGRGVSLSFDDGYLDNLTVAAPLLSTFSFPFSVFVITDFIKNEKKGYLCKSSLRELLDVPGASIGVHGATHKKLTERTEEELRMELAGSKDFLEGILGVPITSMTYPHGAVNERVRRMVKEAGFKLAATSYPGMNGAGCDPLLLSRTEILPLDHPRVFRQKMMGDWDWQSIRRPNHSCLR